MPRRAPCYAPRKLPPLQRQPWRIRTLHPSRHFSVDGVREAFTLDRVEWITLARLRWLERTGWAA